MSAPCEANDPGLDRGSAGIGNGTHLFFELLQKRTVTRMTHVPYKGEVPSLTGLMGGAVKVVMSSISASLPNTLAGKRQPLVLPGANRLKELPNAPSSADLGLKGFESLFRSAIVARAGTPDDVVRRLDALTQQFLAEPQTQRRLAQMYFEAMPGPPEAYETLLAADVRKWTEATRGLDLIERGVDDRYGLHAQVLATRHDVAELEARRVREMGEGHGRLARDIAECNVRIVESKSDLAPGVLAALTAQTALLVGAMKLL